MMMALAWSRRYRLTLESGAFAAELESTTPKF
jgi:hypothetical protein